MNILKKANEIVNERSEEKERQYGDFIECMAKTARIASEMSSKEITTGDASVSYTHLTLPTKA